MHQTVVVECRQLAAGRHAWAVTPGAAGPVVTCSACGESASADTARVELAAGHVAVVTLPG